MHVPVHVSEWVWAHLEVRGQYLALVPTFHGVCGTLSCFVVCCCACRSSCPVNFWGVSCLCFPPHHRSTSITNVQCQAVDFDGGGGGAPTTDGRTATHFFFFFLSIWKALKDFGIRIVLCLLLLLFVCLFWHGLETYLRLARNSQYFGFGLGLLWAGITGMHKYSCLAGIVLE